MGQITGSNNPGNTVEVDSLGRIQARAVSASEQADTAVRGETFNLNTGNVTLTDDTETPLFFIKNDGEDRDLIITRVFFTFLASTAGTGAVNATIVANPTGGSILTDTALEIFNFNVGSGNDLGLDVNIGATGSTVTGGTVPFRFLFTGDEQRQLISIDSIVVPRGSSVVITLTPPASNTSMVVQAGLNMFLAEPS